MTTRIFRLYREIDKSLPDARPYDTSYVRERQEVFEFLQPVSYEKHLKSLGTRVEPLKHHGRLARLRAEASQRKNTLAKRAKELEERMQENHMRAILQEYHDNGKAIVEMKNCIDEKKPIPARTVRDFFAVDSKKYEIKNLILQGELDTVKELMDSTSLTTSPSRKLPPIAVSSSTSSSPIRPMPCFQQPTILVDNRRLFDRTKSKSKWSLEERQKLNTLYREIPLPPPHAKPEIWQLYFEKVAERFYVFYPDRSKQDIRDKLRSMISRRQMKEEGEESYWLKMKGKIAHSSV
jgi:hypothetical protein